MAFYRVGEAFVEVVPSGGPPALMGVAFMCPDLDACVAAVRGAGGAIGDPKPAVQGGRIASVPRDFGLPFGVAVMDER
jgi:predicted enzyme related to lactoylglutathione lyase